MPATPGSHRVVLHVGAPKSGTTFLQRALWRQRSELLRAGVACPGSGGRDMFLAAIEVRDAFDFWGFEREELAGTWAEMCREARCFPGVSVMSHELLAAATEAEVAAALAELAGEELHIVLTARDPARQLMSEWQERVKNGSTQGFDRFRRGVVRQLRSGKRGGPFWRYHDVSAVLERWSATVPAERVHLVTAPQSGGDPLALWRRFGDAVGFDGVEIKPGEDTGGANQSLGVAQIAVLRRLNEALDGRIPQPHYARFVKRQFSQTVLASQRSARPVCPPELLEELGEVARGWCEEVSRRGYQVHGDLDDLLPVPAAIGETAPDAVAEEEVSAAATAALAELLVARSHRTFLGAPQPEQRRPVRPPVRQSSQEPSQESGRRSGQQQNQPKKRRAGEPEGSAPAEPAGLARRLRLRARRLRRRLRRRLQGLARRTVAP